MTKRYINVAYKDRDMAKRLGARWDASVKRWYCPPNSTLAKIYGWRKAPTGQIFGQTLSTQSEITPNLPSNAQMSGRHLPKGQLSLLG
jgi:hypothetical protein